MLRILEIIVCIFYLSIAIPMFDFVLQVFQLAPAADAETAGKGLQMMLMY